MNIDSPMLATKVDRLLRLVASKGVQAPGQLQPITNVVAFSGGIDSSLVAALVHQVFPESSAACIGRSPALASVQLEQAREIASHIGIRLWECHTNEVKFEDYVANQGKSCYYCKTTLYSTLQQVAAFAWDELQQQTEARIKPVLYNGTNADDLLDPTRIGLVAATEFQVVSPLCELTKSEVRDVAKYLGLPNWNAAASPCLRSRLEFGVKATKEHLRRVEKAEHVIRKLLNLKSHRSMRVRFLARNKAAVELDAEALEMSKSHLDIIDAELRRLEFDAVEVRAFRSGSLSGYNVEKENVVRHK
ncbi:putative asparagine synthase, pyridinium-3,5-bisthiocarboxylic acid mononucleotide synthase LarE [Plasmopara halstedii]